APALEAALRDVQVPHWLGLTATPYRSDKMDGLITMQCGPVRHAMSDHSPVAKRLAVHETVFTTDEPGDDGASIQAIYNELALDDSRNDLITTRVCEAVAEGRKVLVLTNRLTQLERLVNRTSEATDVPVLALHGRLAPAERRGIRDDLAALNASGD